MLSDYEKEVLDHLEQQLREDAPELQEELSRTRIQVEARRVAIGLLIVILGLVLLVSGVGTGYVVLGVAGFVFMCLGALYVFRKKPTAAENIDNKVHDSINF